MSGMKEVMLTMIGPDRTGIVARMAGVVESNGGNWLDSRMVRLGGYFSGILRIALPEDSLSGFGGNVSEFMNEVGYKYAIQPAELDEQAKTGNMVELKLSGQDHPGIVHSIFAAFQQSGVNVEELRTGLKAAPWSGTPVFEAHANLHIPDGVSTDNLRDNLESLAADLMVEIDFNQ